MKSTHTERASRSHGVIRLRHRVHALAITAAAALSPPAGATAFGGMSLNWSATASPLPGSFGQDYVITSDSLWRWSYFFMYGIPVQIGQPLSVPIGYSLSGVSSYGGSFVPPTVVAIDLAHDLVFVRSISTISTPAGSTAALTASGCCRLSAPGVFGAFGVVDGNKDAPERLAVDLKPYSPVLSTFQVQAAIPSLIQLFNRGTASVNLADFVTHNPASALSFAFTSPSDSGLSFRDSHFSLSAGGMFTLTPDQAQPLSVGYYDFQVRVTDQTSGYAAISDFMVLLNDGINPSPVPEPSAALSMLAGLFVLRGLEARRRRAEVRACANVTS
jgi:hypothetical protein